MGAVTYPDERVARFINENFVPVQINIVEHPEYTDRFLARWTPTIFYLDSEGREHRRQIGYSLPDDFLAELNMGLAQEAFDNKRYEEAIQRYERIVGEYPGSYVAPEALYMVGVSRYRATDDGSYLGKYWDEVAERYPDSRWARAGDV
jgi:tetratricopeptide (TPR) repeat protein